MAYAYQTPFRLIVACQRRWKQQVPAHYHPGSARHDRDGCIKRHSGQQNSRVNLPTVNWKPARTRSTLPARAAGAFAVHSPTAP